MEIGIVNLVVVAVVIWVVVILILVVQSPDQKEVVREMHQHLDQMMLTMYLE